MLRSQRGGMPTLKVYSLDYQKNTWARAYFNVERFPSIHKIRKGLINTYRGIGGDDSLLSFVERNPNIEKTDDIDSFFESKNPTKKIKILAYFNSGDVKEDQEDFDHFKEFVREQWSLSDYKFGIFKLQNNDFFGSKKERMTSRIYYSISPNTKNSVDPKNKKYYKSINVSTIKLQYHRYTLKQALQT